MTDSDEIHQTATYPITSDNLPTGSFWEADGSCWQYERDGHYPRGYRMRPMNLKAFGKGEPQGPMTNFYLPTKEQFAAQGIKDAGGNQTAKRKHPADGMTVRVECGGGAVMTIIDPTSRDKECGHPEWVLRYGNAESIRYTVASFLSSYDYLLSGRINQTEAVRLLKLMRAARRRRIEESV